MMGSLSRWIRRSAKPHILVGHGKLATLRAKSALNEQDKDHRERYGMASYVWAPDSKHLLFDSNGSLWYYELANGTGIDIGFTGAGSGDDPKFSPNGEYVSFVRNHGLAVVPLRSPETPTLTLAGSPNANILNGEVDWVYMEELDTRSNYFWSPDSKSIAYLQMLEESVPEYPIVDWIPTHATVEKAALSAARRFKSRSACGSRKCKRRENVVGPYSAGARTRLYTAIWVGRSENAVGGDAEPGPEAQEDISLRIREPARAHVVLEISDEKFVNENFDVYVAHGSIVLTNVDGRAQSYLSVSI